MAVVKKERGQLPHNTLEETIVLGTMILDDRLRADALGSLTIEDFYIENYANRVVFTALERVSKKGLSLEDNTSFLLEELRLMNELENVGGLEYITSLTEQVVTMINFEEHIRILKENTTLRQLISLIRQTDDTYVKDGVNSIQEFIMNFESSFSNITATRRISNFINTKELTDRFRQILPTRKGNSLLASGAVTTGYSDLDYYTHGFKKGEYIVIAGRPSMGKTALALNMALQSCKSSNQTIGIFSLEMPNEQIIQRMIAIDGRIKSDNLTIGKLEESELPKLEDAYENLERLKIYVDDSSEQSALDISAKATRLKDSHPDLSMIIIDYLSFIKGDPRLKSEQEKVSEISRQLKSLAKTLEIPVVVLSQLSRGTEGRNDKRPILSDLRSSGSIEQDADIVMLIYREGYYLVKDQEKRAQRFGDAQDKYRAPSKLEEDKIQLEQELGSNGNSLTELIIAKNRNGRTGKVFLLFNLSYGSFDAPAEESLKRIKSIYGFGDSE